MNVALQTVVRCSIAIVLALPLMAARVTAQEEWYPHGRAIGSVEIPALHDAINHETPGAVSTPVPLYIEPTRLTAIAAVVSDRSELLTVEHGYEQISAAVYDISTQRDGTWYRVHYTTPGGSGDGWLSGRETAAYHPLADMLVHGLAFLTDAWDHLVFDAARPDARQRTVDDTRERPDVRVLATAGDAQHLWLRIEMLDGNVCEGKDQPSVVATGWIPAHAADGRLVAWHYPRGC